MSAQLVVVVVVELSTRREQTRDTTQDIREYSMVTYSIVLKDQYVLSLLLMNEKATMKKLLMMTLRKVRVSQESCPVPNFC